MRRLQPLNDFVLVEPIKETETITKGGIVIPCTTKKKIIESIVIGTYKDCNDIQVNSHVIHHSGAGTDFEFEGKDLCILHKPELIAEII